jgi:hypothetical protein
MMKGAMSETKIAANAIAAPETAPCVSPSSNIIAVP